MHLQTHKVDDGGRPVEAKMARYMTYFNCHSIDSHLESSYSFLNSPRGLKNSLILPRSYRWSAFSIAFCNSFLLHIFSLPKKKIICYRMKHVPRWTLLKLKHTQNMNNYSTQTYVIHQLVLPDWHLQQYSSLIINLSILKIYLPGQPITTGPLVVVTVGGSANSDSDSLKKCKCKKIIVIKVTVLLSYHMSHLCCMIASIWRTYCVNVPSVIDCTIGKVNCKIKVPV